MIHVDVLPFPLDGEVCLVAFFACPSCFENLYADIARIPIGVIPCPSCKNDLHFKQDFHDDVFAQVKQVTKSSFQTGAVRVRISGNSRPLFSQ